MAAAARPQVIKHTQLFIDGEFVDSVSGKKFETIDPATEQVITRVAEAEKADVDRAVAAAREAFDHGSWPRMGGRQRSIIMYRIAELIKEHFDELAALEALDNGKPFEMAKIDLHLSYNHFLYYAGWADKICGKTIPVDGDLMAYTLHEPIGVCGQIIPWNFPLLMASWKLAPALAAGNTIVLKVAEQTPLSALRLAQLIKEAGVPNGVVNVLAGYGPTAGAALASHMDVDKLAFTGSVEVGKKVMVMAAESNLKPVTLELGGKSAAIVMDDVLDLDKVVDEAHFGLFFNQGQCCCAGSRVFVHEKIYDEFVAKMVKKTKETKLGEQFDKETGQGPQVSQVQFDRIMNYIKQGVSSGAQIATGGSRQGDKGYFIQPTIFTNVKDDMSIAQEEIFGPVMCIFKFSTVDEVIQRANDSTFGLAAGIWTQNIDTANRVSRSVKAGTVWVNCYDRFDAAIPFGGYKTSGIGRENGEYALKNYTQVKTVAQPLYNPSWL